MLVILISTGFAFMAKIDADTYIYAVFAGENGMGAGEVNKETFLDMLSFARSQYGDAAIRYY